jgi:hypothetical protein
MVQAQAKMTCGTLEGGGKESDERDRGRREHDEHGGGR